METHYENYYKECPIREWLNNDFYNSSFITQEKNKIEYTEITNDNYDVNILDIKDGAAHCNYKTKIERTINDKIFLLSIDEVNKYFSSDEGRICQATLYSIGLGAYNEDGWALRSFLSTRNSVNHEEHRTYGFSYVYNFGAVSDVWGESYEELLIRPAMWINIS